jgi:HK97 gp10 family phage protein
MAEDVTVTWDQGALASIVSDPAVMDQLMEMGRRVAAGAASDAPHRTGEGARSIHPEAHVGLQPEVRVSWDQDHYYLRFHEMGTKHLPARPFLVPALDRYL